MEIPPSLVEENTESLLETWLSMNSTCLIEATQVGNLLQAMPSSWISL